MYNRDKGKVDHEGEWTTFATIMKEASKKNFTNMRVSSSSSKAWNCAMRGEGSIDAGGPYRDSISNLTEELYDVKALPLLIPTQNNKNNHGFNRDCWTINPASTRPKHLEMYKFLGALMGMAFKSGTVIDLKFPPLIWKNLISEPLTLEDLNGTDAYSFQTIQELVNNKKIYDKETFDMAVDITFTTQLSDGSTVPVCPDGELKKVTYDDVEEYNELVLKTRFAECEKQMEKIREGFECIFPIGLLSLLSWKDVEARVRGPNEITVKDLKSITQYN